MTTSALKSWVVGHRVRETQHTKEEEEEKIGGIGVGKHQIGKWDNYWEPYSALSRYVE